MGLVTSARRLDYKLYLALVFRALLPTVYTTFRVAILGSLPEDQVIRSLKVLPP